MNHRGIMLDILSKNKNLPFYFANLSCAYDNYIQETKRMFINMKILFLQSGACLDWNKTYLKILRQCQLLFYAFSGNATLGTLSVVTAMLGMLGASGIFALVFFFTPELFPTNMRSVVCFFSWLFFFWKKWRKTLKKDRILVIPFNVYSDCSQKAERGRPVIWGGWVWVKGRLNCASNYKTACISIRLMDISQES